jgi:hypothetical protein
MTTNYFKEVCASLCIIVFWAFAGIELHSQVTIGSGAKPLGGALLDLKEYDPADASDLTTAEKGLKLPRVKLTAVDQLAPMFDPEADVPTKKAHTGLMVYNVVDETNDAESSIFPDGSGVYVWDGEKWAAARSKSPQWFYMPSIAIDVSTEKPGIKCDLYLEYVKQFSDTEDANMPPNSPVGGTPLVASDGAPALFTKIYDKADLRYYVTGYDAAVFDNIRIDADGVMTYDVIGPATDATYMNIVFVLKK